MASDIVSRNLRRIREERGLSQARLGGRAEVNPATVNQIEMGARVPHIPTLERLAEVLDVSLADFFAEADSPKKNAPVPQSEETVEQRRSSALANTLSAAAEAWLRAVSGSKVSRDEARTLAAVARTLESPLSVLMGNSETWTRLSRQERSDIAEVTRLLGAITEQFDKEADEKLERDTRLRELEAQFETPVIGA